MEGKHEHTVKPVLIGHSQKTNYRLMQAKSITECSNGAFHNAFDLHLTTICH